MPYPDEDDQASHPPSPTEELSERGKRSNRNLLAAATTSATAMGVAPQQAKPDMRGCKQHPGKRRDILSTDVISIVGAIAAVPATVAVTDFSNGHFYRGFSFAGMAFLIAGIPSVGFLFDHLRSRE